MRNNTAETDSSKKRERKKALWWSLLWSNVVMLLVLLLTFLFEHYLYTQLIAHTFVEVDINPLIVALGYVVGMLVLWAIIYKYETSDNTHIEEKENHNIY